jgi:hypothetical protein
MVGVLFGISSFHGWCWMVLCSQTSHTYTITCTFDTFRVARLLLRLHHNIAGYLSDILSQNSPVFKQCDITYVKTLPFQNSSDEN